ncbi:MAG: hypothetical protein WC375_06560 [Methanomassiliicoccales archaeon]|jgi:uncharacterized membrane protein YoaK (UPF0700 family)
MANKLENRHAGALLGFVLGAIIGEIFYYFTDQLVFFIIVIIMSILGWVLGTEADIKERTGKE